MILFSILISLKKSKKYNTFITFVDFGLEKIKETYIFA